MLARTHSSSIAYLAVSGKMSLGWTLPVVGDQYRLPLSLSFRRIWLMTFSRAYKFTGGTSGPRCDTTSRGSSYFASGFRNEPCPTGFPDHRTLRVFFAGELILLICTSGTDLRVVRRGRVRHCALPPHCQSLWSHLMPPQEVRRRGDWSP